MKIEKIGIEATYQLVEPGTVAGTVTVREDLLVDVASDGRVIGVERIGGSVGSGDLVDIIRALRYEPAVLPAIVTDRKRGEQP